MKQQLTKLLSLPGLIVKSYKQLENTLILEIQNKSKTAFCPKCKKCSARLHQNHYCLIKDIPWGENEVFLRINRRQFKCDNGLTPFSEELDFVKKRQKHTPTCIIHERIEKKLKSLPVATRTRL